MDRSRRPFSLLGALLIVATLLPVSATSVAAASADVPVGFADEAVFTGLNHPMAVAFGPDGKVYVAEKRGVIMVYDSLSDTTPTVFADLHTNVHNYWDRGLMGLAVDPGFLTGKPYVYVLYAYNHILGDSAPAPKWPPVISLHRPGWLTTSPASPRLTPSATRRPRSSSGPCSRERPHTAGMVA